MLVFTDRNVFRLRLVPFEEQIQALVGRERFEEALLLIDGCQRPLDSYEVKCRRMQREPAVQSGLCSSKGCKNNIK